MEQGPEKSQEIVQERLQQRFEEIKAEMAKMESMMAEGKISDPAYSKSLEEMKSISLSISHLCDTMKDVLPGASIESNG
jgi:hypothetical protein